MDNRIIVVTRSTIFHSQTGGIETQLNNLLEGLQDKYKITVLTTELPLYTERFVNKQGHYEYTETPNLKYIFFDNTNIGSSDIQPWHKIIYNLSVLPIIKIKLLKIFRLKNSQNNFRDSIQNYIDDNKNEIGIIISQSTSITTTNVYNIPLLTIIHGTINGELKGRYNWLSSLKSYIRFFGLDLPNLLLIKYLIDKKVYERSDRIIAVSDNLNEDFIKSYPQLKSKVSTIFNGVDDAKLKNSKTFQLPLKIIYVGKIDKEKGLEIISEVIKKIDFNKYKIEFTIIGNGDYYQDLQNLVTSKNLISNVKLLGKQPQAIVYEHFKSSHLFLFPTLRIEGHPMVLIESMLSGTVPMVNPLGGIKDVINEKNGIILKPNAIDIINNIDMLYNNLDNLKEIHKQTLVDGMKYSQSKMIDNYDKILKTLIN